MPVVVKLSPEEVAQLKLQQFGPKARLREEYDALLTDVEIGDFGELQLTEQEQEKSRHIRTMLQQAATRKGMRLTFKGMLGTSRLIFEVVSRGTGGGFQAYQAQTEETLAPKVEPKTVPVPEQGLVKNDEWAFKEEPSTIPVVEKRRPGRPVKVTKPVAK